jgi:hypothetical protein
MHSAIAEASVYFCKGLSHITEMISANTGLLHPSPAEAIAGAIESTLSIAICMPKARSF